MTGAWNLCGELVAIDTVTCETSKCPGEGVAVADGLVAAVAVAANANHPEQSVATQRSAAAAPLTARAVVLNDAPTIVDRRGTR